MLWLYIIYIIRDNTRRYIIERDIESENLNLWRALDTAKRKRVTWIERHERIPGLGREMLWEVWVVLWLSFSRWGLKKVYTFFPGGSPPPRPIKPASGQHQKHDISNVKSYIWGRPQADFLGGLGRAEPLQEKSKKVYSKEAEHTQI